MMRSAVFIVLSTLAAHSAGAQSPSCIGGDLSRYPTPVAPLQDDRPMDGTTRYDMTVQQPHDSVPQPLGTMTVTQTTTRCGGNDVVRRVIVYDYGARGRVVDTTVSIALTLAPILERTHKRSGDITLDFARGVVRGSMVRAGKLHAIRDTLPAPAFNSTDLELVVRSLALKPGMTATLEIYDPEYGGARGDSVSVLRLDPPRITGTEATWVVRSRDRRLESTYRITEHSRKLLSADIRADTTRYRIDVAPNAP